MTLGTLTKIELNKFSKRKDVWLTLLILIVPLLNSIGVHNNVMSANNENIYCFSFVIKMQQIIFGIHLFYILFLFIVIKTFGKEVEDKSILLYLVRIKNRKQIYISKIISLILLYTYILVIFSIFSITVYHLFFNKATYLFNTYDNKELIYFIISNISIYLYNILLIELAMFLCTLFRSSVAFISSISIVLITYYLEKLSIVKNIIPSHYIKLFMDKTFIDDTTNLEIFLLKFIFIILAYSTVLNLIGINKFKKVNL